MKKPNSNRMNMAVRVAIVGALATIIVAMINLIGQFADAEHAGLKARQELQPTISALETKVSQPTATLQVEQLIMPDTGMGTPTLITTPTLSPNIIDEMEKVLNWKTILCNNECSDGNGSSSIFLSLVAGKTNNALEILYDVRKAGWVLIIRDIDVEVLSRTKGISFSYKGTGAPNTIELKLLARYPGDDEDTAFGASWQGATDTRDKWALIEALYDVHFTCWWPEILCKEHGYTPLVTPLNIPDLTAVKRMDLAISNKSGDTAGLGRVAFDDLMGIP